MTTATREEVYRAIDTERVYQDKRWNRDTTTSEGNHTVGEWVLYMQDYLEEARQQLTRMADPVSTQLALNTVRKITAMGVVCMEQNGAPTRA